jgi:formyl-CoA transferase
LAISAALYQRKATGHGQYIDVAMLDAAISLLSQSAGGWLNAGVVQKRRANLSISREPTSDTFRTADGTVMLAVMRDEHFAILARELGLEQLANDPRCATREARVANTAFIKPLVQAELMKAGTSEWKRRLDAAGVPCSPVLELADALAQPQVKHRGLVVEMQDEETGARMRSFNASFQYAHDSPGPAFPPQRLGAQTETVLSELGYSKAEIAALAERGAI